MTPRFDAAATAWSQPGRDLSHPFPRRVASVRIRRKCVCATIGVVSEAELEDNMHRPLVLITGASGGIGAELARQYATDGADLVLVARSEDKLRAVAKELESHGAEVHVLRCDLAQPGAAGEVYTFARSLDRPVDVLVNNAGIGLFGPFAEQTVDDQLQLVRLNVEALTHLCAVFVPDMVARGRGQILQVGSIAGFQPGPLMATYYASKAYVLSLTEALAVELEGTGVSMSVLCPGPVATGFQATAKMDSPDQIKMGLTPVDEVARAGRRALAQKRVVAIVGFTNKVATFLATRLAPRWLTPRIVRRIQQTRT